LLSPLSPSEGKSGRSLREGSALRGTPLRTLAKDLTKERQKSFFFRQARTRAVGSLGAHKRANIAVPRQKRGPSVPQRCRQDTWPWSIMVSRGVLVGRRRRFRVRLCPATIISFRSAARGPCAGPWALMGGVGRRHNRRRARESGISTAHDISPSSR